MLAPNCADRKNAWQSVLLGDCIVVNDSTYSPKESWPFVNYLDTGNITENRVSEIRTIVNGKDKLPSRARRKVKSGDIVYSTVRPNQRHFGLVKVVPEYFLASTGFAVIRGKDDKAITDFIYWYLAQDHIVDQLQTIAEQTTSAYPSIKPNDIQCLELELPSLPEQRAIAHILGTLDDKIELNRRMNETLEEMARALFKSWFVDFDPVRAKMEGRWRRGQSLPGMPAELYDLFPDGMVSSELGEIPAGWEVSEIGREVDVVGGSTPSTKEPAFWEEGDTHWATPKDLSNLQNNILLGTERKITSAGLKKISSGLLPVGTVLMSSRAPVGYLAISQVPLAVNQGFIAMKCCKDISEGYTLFWCEENMDVIKANASGTTFAEISKKNFRPLSIIVPTSDVLRVFDDEVNPVMERVIANENESRSLVTLRDALLPRLISGKLQVTQRRKRRHD